MYKRVIRLEASNFSDKEPIFTTVEHRISFELEVGLAQGLAMARVQIYNLAIDQIKALTRSDIESISSGDGKNNRQLEKVRIKLFAGYEDELDDKGKPPLVIDGFVMNSASLKKLPENITFLYVIASGSNLLIQDFTTFSTPDSKSTPMKVKDVILRLCVGDEGAGYEAANINFDSAPVAIMEKPVIAHTYTNGEKGLIKALDEVAEEFHFNWGTRANGIAIYPLLADSAKDSSEFNVLIAGKSLKISPLKIRGTPLTGMATIQIPHNLDATLIPGLLIDVGDLKGLIDYTHLGETVYFTDDIWKYAVFQYYMVKKIIHKGDTHGSDWQSTISCMFPSSGKTSDNEIKQPKK